MKLPITLDDNIKMYALAGLIALAATIEFRQHFADAAPIQQIEEPAAPERILNQTAFSFKPG